MGYIRGIYGTWCLQKLVEHMKYMKEIARSQMAQGLEDSKMRSVRLFFCAYKPARSWAAIEAPVLQLYLPIASMGRTVYFPAFTIKNQPHVGRYTMHGSYGYGLVGI